MGHSFIRRLDEYMKNSDDANLRLYRHLFSVSVETHGGLTMYHMGRSRLYTQFSEIPDICFCILGKKT